LLQSVQSYSWQMSLRQHQQTRHHLARVDVTSVHEVGTGKCGNSAAAVEKPSVLNTVRANYYATTVSSYGNDCVSRYLANLETFDKMFAQKKMNKIRGAFTPQGSGT